jgi:hypothetical protein
MRCANMIMGWKEVIFDTQNEGEERQIADQMFLKNTFRRFR